MAISCDLLNHLARYQTLQMMLDAVGLRGWQRTLVCDKLQSLGNIEEIEIETRRELLMRKVVVFTNLTLDGVMQALGRGPTRRC